MKYSRHIVTLLLLSSCIFLSCCLSARRGSPLESVEAEIRGGDAAFKYGYNTHALGAYQEAERQLEGLSQFELRSLKRDTSLLQRYQNIAVLLEARIEIAKMAIEIQQLELPKRNE